MIIVWYIPTSYKRATKYVPLSLRGKIISITTRKVVRTSITYCEEEQVA